MDKLHPYNELRKRYDHIQDRFIDLFREMLAEIEAKDEEIATLKSSIEPVCYTQESALQHGLFLADAAESFLDAVNRHDEMVDAGVDDDFVQAALDMRSEAWERLQSAIHEFKKRV